MQLSKRINFYKKLRNTESNVNLRLKTSERSGVWIWNLAFDTREVPLGKDWPFIQQKDEWVLPEEKPFQ